MGARCVCVAVLIGVGAVPASLAATAPSVAPVIEFQAIPALESVERDKEVKIFLAVMNRSRAVVRNVRLSVLSDAYSNDGTLSLAPSLAPYGSIEKTLTIKPIKPNRDANVTFGQHKILLTLKYTWSLEGEDVQSAQEATIGLQIKRRFEEEAKGFPGGTAAFLYLLLPVVPAFLSYDAVEKLRRGEGFQIPTFRNEYIAFAFLLAVALSFLMLVTAHYDLTVGYSDPRWFVGVLFASAVAGAVVPGIRWGCAVFRDRRWGFTNRDTPTSYLEKALLGPQTSKDFVWAKGTVNGEQWEGFLLQQPNGAKVLGAQMQVSPAPQADQPAPEEDWNRLKEAVDNISVLENRPHRQRLVDLVKSGRVDFGFEKKIERDGTKLGVIVVVDGLAKFQQTGGEPVPFAKAVR